MRSADPAGAVSFTQFDGEPAVVARAASLLGQGLAGPVDGHLGSARYTSFDAHVVVQCDGWTDPSAYTAAADAVAAVADHAARTAGIGRPDLFVGQPAIGIHGPAVGQPPGVVAVATRHFRNRAGAEAVLRMLRASSEWKSTFPGFIEATPIVRADGLAFVNLVSWVDRAAYDAWMANPRLGAGQSDVARYEAQPPRYVVCTASASD